MDLRFLGPGQQLVSILNKAVELRSKFNSREIFSVEINIFVSNMLVSLRFSAALELKKSSGRLKLMIPTIFCQKRSAGLRFMTKKNEKVHDYQIHDY